MAAPGSDRNPAKGALLALLLGIAWGAPASATEAAADLVLSIDSPLPGAAIGAPGGLALVTGRARASGARPLDLLIALDTSSSTAERARPRAPAWRRWLARLFGPVSNDAPPTAFEIGIRRALALVDALDAPDTRVGVVAFADTAWVAAPLGNPAHTRAALHALRARGARGATNLIDALERARVELAGDLGASSPARSGARRAAILITDGVDVHPLYPDAGQARALLLASAESMRAAGIELSLVVTAAAAPELREALASAGATLDDAPLAALPHPNRALVSIRNSTSGASATTRPGADGGFAALVRLEPGSNRLEICAHSRSGRETTRVLELVWNPEQPEGPLPLELLRIRNQLLAGHLEALHVRRRTHALSIAAQP